MEEKPRFKPGMMLRTKSCSVCGQTIFMYMRICDRCGSIQRIARGSGEEVPPERLDTCVLCGQPAVMSENPLGHTVCTACEEAVEAQGAWRPRTPSEKATAVTAGSLTAASAGATAWAIAANLSSASTMAIVSVSGVVMAASIGSLLYMLLRSRRASVPMVHPKPSEETAPGDSGASTAGLPPSRSM